MKSIELIGNTPVIQIPNTNIYVKLEKYNLGGSVKDRAVLYMLKDALKKGLIKKDTVLIEATSGNTGIALAMLGALYHVPVKIVMPETMSIERRQLMSAYGAEIVLSDGSKGMSGAITVMESLKKEHQNYLSLGQFDNEANVLAHYETTAVELLKQVPNMDVFVACAGTGGTFSGVAKRLKEEKSHVRTILGEPMKSAVVSGQKAGSHKIQGIGANFIPSILNRDLIDDIMLIDDEEAMQEAIAFAKENGVLVGISSGANIALAKRLAQYDPNQVIVTIAPDGGEKYLSVLPFGK